MAPSCLDLVINIYYYCLRHSETERETHAYVNARNISVDAGGAAGRP